MIRGFNIKFLKEADEFLESLDDKARHKVIYNIHKAQFTRVVKLNNSGNIILNGKPWQNERKRNKNIRVGRDYRQIYW